MVNDQARVADDVFDVERAGVGDADALRVVAGSRDRALTDRRQFVSAKTISVAAPVLRGLRRTEEQRREVFGLRRSSWSASSSVTAPFWNRSASAATKREPCVLSY